LIIELHIGFDFFTFVINLFLHILVR